MKVSLTCGSIFHVWEQGYTVRYGALMGATAHLRNIRKNLKLPHPWNSEGRMYAKIKTHNVSPKKARTVNKPIQVQMPGAGKPSHSSWIPTYPNTLTEQFLQNMSLEISRLSGILIQWPFKSVWLWLERSSLHNRSFIQIYSWEFFKENQSFATSQNIVFWEVCLCIVLY